MGKHLNMGNYKRMQERIISGISDYPNFRSSFNTSDF